MGYLRKEPSRWQELQGWGRVGGGGAGWKEQKVGMCEVSASKVKLSS